MMSYEEEIDSRSPKQPSIVPLVIGKNGIKQEMIIVYAKPCYFPRSCSIPFPLHSLHWF